MDFDTASRRLALAGAGLLVVALFWWAEFYGQVTKFTGGTLSDAFGCLYSFGGICGFVSGMGQMAGAVPYHAGTFWLAVVFLGTAAVIRRPGNARIAPTASPVGPDPAAAHADEVVVAVCSVCQQPLSESQRSVFEGRSLCAHHFVEAVDR